VHTYLRLYHLYFAFLMALLTTAHAYLASPLGTVGLYGIDAGLTSVQFLDEGLPETAPAAVPECLREAYRQVGAYFGRDLRDFTLRYNVGQGTDFQRRVWAALSAVEFGRTAS
jgi:methylated-DNA-[protein]-cysteine S-methyltransferase